MNIVSISDATQNFIKRKPSKYSALREMILGLADGQALFVPFEEYSEKAITTNVANLRRSREQCSLSMRRHQDGTGMFVFFVPAKG